MGREEKGWEGKGPGSIVSREVPVRSKMEKRGARDLKETRTLKSYHTRSEKRPIDFSISQYYAKKPPGTIHNRLVT